MKTYQFERNGNKIKLEITYNKTLIKTPIWADGYYEGLEREEIREESRINVYINNEYKGSKDSIRIDDVMFLGDNVPADITHYIKVFTSKEACVIGFTEEHANKIKEIIEELKKENTSIEAKQYEGKEIAQELKKQKEIAKETIERAKKQSSIPTYEVARKIERNYNAIQNEGGEGYVPHIVDREGYEEALRIIGGEEC